MLYEIAGERQGSLLAKGMGSRAWPPGLAPVFAIYWLGVSYWSLMCLRMHVLSDADNNSIHFIALLSG